MTDAEKLREWLYSCNAHCPNCTAMDCIGCDQYHAMRKICRELLSACFDYAYMVPEDTTITNWKDPGLTARKALEACVKEIEK